MKLHQLLLEVKPLSTKDIRCIGEALGETSTDTCLVLRVSQDFRGVELITATAVDNLNHPDFQGGISQFVFDSPDQLRMIMMCTPAAWMSRVNDALLGLQRQSSIAMILKQHGFMDASTPSSRSLSVKAYEAALAIWNRAQGCLLGLTDEQTTT